MIEQTEIVPLLEADRPSIEYMEEEYLLAVPLDFSLGDEDIAWAEASQRLMTHLKAFPAMQLSFDVGAIVTRDNLLRGMEEVSYCYSRLSAPVPSEAVFIKPASYYATMIHKGPYEKLPRSGERLIEYIEKSGREITGNAYILDVLTYLATGNEDDFVVQISIQID